MPTMVRIHPSQPELWGIGTVATAPALQAGIRRFDFDILHHFLLFRSGAVVAQVTVNHLVAGSNPAFGANLPPSSIG